MNNNVISFLDNVQYSCYIKDNNIMLLQNIGNALTVADDHKLVSYMIKGKKDKEILWEMGIGTIRLDGSSHINRTNIISSSHNNPSYDGYDLYVYIIPNSFNYNTGFNNIIFKDSDFNVPNNTAVYILEPLHDAISVTLPNEADSSNVVLEFKNIKESSICYIFNTDKSIIDILHTTKTYTKIVCDGSQWFVLPDNKDNESMNILSSATGDNYSLQYNIDGNFGSTNVYHDMSSKDILLGDNGHSILATAVNRDTIFNNLKSNSDFIVYASGNKNLHWDGQYGRLGINIPSGSSPACPMHIINIENCAENLRLENRNPNTTANLALYHRPSILPATGTVCSSINFNTRDNTNSTFSLAKIYSSVNNNTYPNTSGSLSIDIQSNGILSNKLYIDSNKLLVSMNTNILEVSSTGTQITGPVYMPHLVLDAGIISFTGIPSDCAYDYGPAPTLTPTPTPTPTPVQICPIDGSGSGSGSGDGVCEPNILVASLYIDGNGKEYIQIQGALEIGSSTAAKRTVYVQDSTVYQPENTEAFFPVIYSTSPVYVELEPYIASEPFAISGHYPLYTTEQNAIDSIDGFNPDVLEFTFYNKTYYMPTVQPYYPEGGYTGPNAPVVNANFGLNAQHHVLINGRRIHQYVGDNTTTSANGYNLNFLGVYWKTLNSDGNFDTNT